MAVILWNNGYFYRTPSPGDQVIVLPGHDIIDDAPSTTQPGGAEVPVPGSLGDTDTTVPAAWCNVGGEIDMVYHDIHDVIGYSVVAVRSQAAPNAAYNNFDINLSYPSHIPRFYATRHTPHDMFYGVPRHIAC